MIGRGAVIGLSLLSALLFCTFAAQSASAAKSTSTTFFTCVEGGGAKDFQNAHCDQGVDDGREKIYGHMEIAPDSGTTEVGVTNLKTASGTTATTQAVLKGEVAGAKVTISCINIKTKESGSGEKSVSTIQNTTTVVEGKKLHTATGVAVVEYSKCFISELTKCVVAEPIVISANVTGVDKLGAGANEMGLEFVGSEEEETFGTIEFKNKTGEACSLNGASFKVKGSAIATSGQGLGAPQTNKSGGATMVFISTGGMQSLKFGPEPATFTTIHTATKFFGNTISMTTVTT